MQTPRRGFRPLAAFALSLALALTGVATLPTQAQAQAQAQAQGQGQGQNAAAVIAGLIALYAISRAIDKRQDRQQAAPVPPPPPPPLADHQRPRGGHGQGAGRHARFVPEACYREFDTWDGIARGYGARCMQNRVARPGLLPPECITRVRTTQGIRTLYSGRCLAQNGWQREGRAPR